MQILFCQEKGKNQPGSIQRRTLSKTHQWSLADITQPSIAKSSCAVAKTYTIDHSVLYQTSLILREFGCIDNSCLLACSKLQQNYDLLAKKFYGPANLNILKVSWEQRGNLSNVSNQNVSVCHDLSSLFPRSVGTPYIRFIPDICHFFYTGKNFGE